MVAVGTSAGMVRACASRRPDVALVADDLPADGGVRTVERLVAAIPAVLVVVWTDTPDGEDALAAIRAGARGVLARDIGRDALTRSIMQVAAGEVALPRYLARAVVEELQGIERRSQGPSRSHCSRPASRRCSRSWAKAGRTATSLCGSGSPSSR